MEGPEGLQTAPVLLPLLLSPQLALDPIAITSNRAPTEQLLLNVMASLFPRFSRPALLPGCHGLDLRPSVQHKRLEDAWRSLGRDQSIVLSIAHLYSISSPLRPCRIMGARHWRASGMLYSSCEIIRPQY
jgi:hypothetical protein